MTQKNLHPPPPDETLCWRCTVDGHVEIVTARLAFDARRLACRRFHERGIVTDEQSIRVELHEEPVSAQTNGRVHVVGDGYEILRGAV